jgi:hypothetical protein
MELTGQAKIDFDKWIFKQDEIYSVRWATRLPDSMKYGVIVDFADSVGVDVSIRSLEQDRFDWRTFEYDKNDIAYSETFFETRPEARREAVKKFNELYNEKWQ